MLNLKELVSVYLDYCYFQKKLSSKTLKAYRIDLKQFLDYTDISALDIKREDLSKIVTQLHNAYKPKTVKRKVASLKAFFSYLEYEEIILDNPFSKLKIKFKEPFFLPKTILPENLEKIFNTAYNNIESNHMTIYKKKSIIRDIAVLETLFGTGLRVSELCSIRKDEISISKGTTLIYGKGSKERIIQVTNAHILKALLNYQVYFKKELEESVFFL